MLTSAALFFWQVFYVIVQFGGLLPESVRIQRRRLLEQHNGSVTEQPWQDWQYMARNCSVFEMQNNGPLLKPDSVNCLQLPRSVRRMKVVVVVIRLSSNATHRPMQLR